MAAVGTHKSVPRLWVHHHIHLAVVLLNADGRFGLRVEALGHGRQAKLGQLGRHTHNAVDGLINRIHRPSAQRRIPIFQPIWPCQTHRGRGNRVVATRNLDVVQLPRLVGLVQLIGNNSADVRIGNHFFLVCQPLEPVHRLPQLILVEVVPQFPQASIKRVFARMFAQHQAGSI